MHRAIRFFAILTLTCVGACSGSYDRIETGGTERTNIVLDENAAVLVTTPADGGYNGRIFEGSAAVVARRIDASFSRYARLVDVTPIRYHSLNELGDLIAKNDYKYVVVPTILTWGRKDKDWSRIPNQINIKVLVLDATTGREISSNFLEGKGATSVFDQYGEGPEDLLSDAADDYTDSLYGALISLIR